MENRDNVVPFKDPIKHEEEILSLAKGKRFLCLILEDENYMHYAVNGLSCAEIGIMLQEAVNRAHQQHLEKCPH